MANLHTGTSALNLGLHAFSDALYEQVFGAFGPDMPDTAWPFEKNRQRRAKRRTIKAVRHPGNRRDEGKAKWGNRRVHLMGQPEPGHHLRLTPDVLHDALDEARYGSNRYSSFDDEDELDGFEMLELEDSAPDRLRGWDEEDWLEGMDEPDEQPDAVYGYR